MTVDSNRTREELVRRIIDRIAELSTFDYNHEGWWTLSYLMDQPIPSLVGFGEEDYDVQVTDLFALISDDTWAMELMTFVYQSMRANGGRRV